LAIPIILLVMSLILEPDKSISLLLASNDTISVYGYGL
jgi:hypothetical protein